jgi:hypothetical protein
MAVSGRRAVLPNFTELRESASLLSSFISGFFDIGSDLLLARLDRESQDKEP